VIYGNNGANSLIGGGGADTMYGFGGDDSYFVDSASDQVIELAGQGNDTVYTNVSYALAASANVETLTVYDRTSTNAIDLTGSDSANVIYGNNGDNVIYGRAGNDVFYGLGGADTFRLVNANNISHDTVMDFTAGVDRIELDHTNFFGLAVGTLPDSAFVIGSSAQDADDRIIYDINNGNLYFDPDGKGFNNQVLIAHFDNHAVLTASDFHVI
jgi:Ca2+-binding RTX toxin-like protein